MFTIEHEFDATVITLIDDANGAHRPLMEDVVITAFDDRVTLTQPDADGHDVATITLSAQQLAELRAALNLPEGNYRLEPRAR